MKRRREIAEIRLLKLKFPCIVEWCRVMQSYEYYVVKELHEAERDNAPRNAVYKTDDRWVTADEIQNSDLKYINELVKP